MFDCRFCVRSNGGGKEANCSERVRNASVKASVSTEGEHEATVFMFLRRPILNLFLHLHLTIFAFHVFRILKECVNAKLPCNLISPQLQEAVGAGY
jgi:hypothetical protein